MGSTVRRSMCASKYASMRPDVAPVAGVPFGRAGHLVGHEVVGLRRAVCDQRRDDVPADVVPAVESSSASWRSASTSTFGVEHVDAHRRERLLRVSGHRRRVGGLLQERVDRPPVARRRRRCRTPWRPARHRDAPPPSRPRRARRCWSIICLGSIRYTWSAPTTTTMSGFSSLIRFIDWKMASAEPVYQCGPSRCCAGHRRHVVAEQVAHPPRGGDVPVQAVALVLGEHADLPDAAVRQVGQREVDQPVHTAERHGGLGPVRGQRREAGSGAAGEHDAQD